MQYGNCPTHGENPSTGREGFDGVSKVNATLHKPGFEGGRFNLKPTACLERNRSIMNTVKLLATNQYYLFTQR